MVLGCAKAERGRMAPLVEAFAAQEHHVELVSGVDESRQHWREVGQRWGTRAVYVVCGGPGLPAAELAALRHELVSLGIPPTSIWAEVVDWSQLDRLLREVDRMIGEAPVMVPAPPPLSTARPIGPSAPPPAPPPPPAPLHVVGPTVVPAGAVGTIAPMLPPTSASLAPVAASRDASRVSLAPPLADDRGSQDSMDSMDPMIERFGGSRRRMLWTLGTLAAATLVAVVVLTRPDGTGTDDGSRGADAVSEASAGQGAAAAAARTVATPSRANEPPSLASTVATAEPSAAAAERAAAAPAPGIARPSDDDAVVHDALMHRKIRALDILLVSPEATRKIKGRRTARPLHASWADAQAYCESLDIDGVTGWRLPTAGEFRTLGTSNMLGRRIYWSATEADAFGSDRVVWNNQKKRMAPAPASWKGGRVLCVRFQHPERVSPT